MRIAPTRGTARALLPSLLVLMLMAGGTGAAELEAVADKAADKPGTGLFDRAKSLFGGDAKPAEPAAAKPEEAESGGLFSGFGRMLGIGASGSGGSATKVKDINEVFNVSATEFDPECKSMVEPFGVTDNLLSLGMLAAKISANNFLATQGSGGVNQNLRSTLRLAGKNLNWLPMEAERMLGERMHQEKEANLLDAERKGSKPAIERANAMLAKLKAQIKEETPYKFDIYVRKGAGNAQALPGGFIHIDRDLVTDPKKEDKAYFALAHELAHVLQRHETRSTQARLTDGIESLDGLRKIIDSATNPGKMMAYSNELMTRFVVFSKSQELQADSCAVRLLDGLYSDKKRLAQVIRAYQSSLGPPVAAAGETGNQLDMFISNLKKMDKLDDQHPNSKERVENLDKMLAEVAKPKTATTAAATPAKAAPVVSTH